ncbi:anaerobic ribonucleoside-triphosphate reductase [Allochromatium vinosum]|uniref:Uncharacterized protein n=1 Tax=Allochromatium vinosum (strain ATCC 17899 / DSM 180 / NBRC 103801 / NCIMB 10441 / D) TaxID=572477 RepID=D3RWA0_ALLVD|nr:anaerobic ribonucleoside-triphosphate reductase [Allochromatium vinosum]ADC64112.1 conserved hypothetical protein [Allochromatium vinosum DSM 180]
MSRSTIPLDDTERTRCEVWTRVMGYHRPIDSFNVGKQAEHAERCYFREPGAEREHRPRLSGRAQLQRAA